jgi:formylglycine-generating enzyme required for sulfatase activity
MPLLQNQLAACRPFCRTWGAGFVTAALALCGNVIPIATVEAADRPTLPIEKAVAGSAEEMKAYEELIEHTDTKIDMLPIPGGTFMMGSPESEDGRSEDEGPQHEVKISPFWMSKCEITWEAFEVWMFDLDIARRRNAKREPNDRDKAADEFQISQPTQPYTDMSFGMGKRGYPAISMTQTAARVFCEWLSAKTGRYYRLPTEAEWEYACRAGSRTAYSFGDDVEKLGDYGWFLDNSDERYHPVGKKKPNAWGLHDMHGNVAEWVLDQHSTDFYATAAGRVVENPLLSPNKEWGRVTRGGSWQDEPQLLRSAGRMKSIADWKKQDPQIPKSIWYLTDAQGLGFRIVRPLTEPTAEERAAKWDKVEPIEDRKAGRR